MFSPSTRTNVRRPCGSAPSAHSTAPGALRGYAAPPGDGGQHDDLVAVGELGLEAADEPHVLVVDVDVDEAAQVAVLDAAAP